MVFADSDPVNGADPYGMCLIYNNRYLLVGALWIRISYWCVVEGGGGGGGGGGAGGQDACGPILGSSRVQQDARWLSRIQKKNRREQGGALRYGSSGFWIERVPSATLPRGLDPLDNYNFPRWYRPPGFAGIAHTHRESGVGRLDEDRALKTRPGASDEFLDLVITPDELYLIGPSSQGAPLVATCPLGRRP